MAQKESKENEGLGERPRVIDATPERLFLRAGGVPAAVADLRGATLPDVQFLEATGEANVAMTLAGGHADAAVVPLDRVEGLVDEGAAAPLPLCGPDVNLEGISLHAVNGRPHAVIITAAPANGVVIAPATLARLEALGNPVPRVLTFARSIIGIFSRINGIFIDGIEPVDRRSASPTAACADFDYKYKASWFTFNAEVIDVVWTKIGSPRAAVSFRASSSKNPGPTYPIADQCSNTGNPVFGHQQIDKNNTSEFQVPM